MPTVIDSLLVEIGLQSKDFDKNSAAVDEKLRRTREQAQITGKDTEDSAKKMGLSFAKVRGEVVGLFLAFAGAKSMVQFAENAINTAAAAGHLGAVLGQQTTTIHAWNSALEARGGQKGEAGGYFSKIAEFYADFTRHPEIIGQNAVLFAQLGLRGKEDFSNPEQLIYHLSDQYQREMANAGSNPGAQQQVKATFAQRMREFLGASNEMIDWVEPTPLASPPQSSAVPIFDPCWRGACVVPAEAVPVVVGVVVGTVGTVVPPPPPVPMGI